MSSTTKKNTNQQPTKPVQVFRARGVKVSVFENRTGETVWFKTTLLRIYRETESEEWKTTTSLSRDDLPIAARLLQKAWDFILETESGRNGGNGDAQRSEQ